MVEAKDIEVGDWVIFNGYNWEKVIIVQTGSGVVDSVNGVRPKDITAHRKKSGPFKVGDVARNDYGDEFVVSKVEELVLHSSPAWFWPIKDCTLVKPVEAVSPAEKPADIVGAIKRRIEPKLKTFNVLWHSEDQRYSSVDIKAERMTVESGAACFWIGSSMTYALATGEWVSIVEKP